MKSAKLVVIIMMILGMWLGAAVQIFSAQAPSAGEKGSPDPPKGDLQRSAEILYSKRLADSGSERGKEIYFYKCWVCHNTYTRAAGSIGPSLKDLYKRPKLLTGEPVNDESVGNKIKNGGPLMPGYRYALSDQDLADLLSFFREGKCCWEEHEEHNPPANPRYKAK